MSNYYRAIYPRIEPKLTQEQERFLDSVVILTGWIPPLDLVRLWYDHDSDTTPLEEWVLYKIKPELGGLTGMRILEAAHVLANSSEDVSVKDRRLNGPGLESS